jgi:hypothetical protein
MIALSAEPPALVHYVPSPAQGEDAWQVAQIHQRLKEARQASRPVAPPFDVLDRELAADVFEKWPKPCEAAFEYLAGRAPGGLLSLIRSGRLDVADLTFAAEIAGRIADSIAVRAVLAPLLTHAEPVVREGALYGLTRHVDSGLRASIEDMALHDASEAVRTVARDVLDEV